MATTDPSHDELAIEHDRASRTFHAELGGQSAVLHYELLPGVMDITHTETPDEFRGRGIAAKLARAALEWARSEGLAVIPSCSYVAAYVRRNPEYADLVRNG